MDTSTTAGKDKYAVISTLRSMQICNFLTPITTQSYMPIIPFLLTVEYDEHVSLVGFFFSALAIGSFASFMVMPILLTHFRTKRILMADFAIRCIAAIIWVYALWNSAEYSKTDTLATLPSTVPLLLASRLLFGLTLNSFAIADPWIASRMENDEMPSAMALAGSAISLGVMLGPMVGIGIVSVVKVAGYDAMLGYMVVGWFTVWLSLVQLLIIIHFFKDETILAPSDSDATTTDPDSKARDERVVTSNYYPTAKFVGKLVIVSSFTNSFAILAGFESTLTLQVRQAYGWSLAESMYAWGPMAVFGLVFNSFVVPGIIDHYNWATVARFGLIFSWFSIFGINWLNLLEPVPWWWFVIEGIFGLGGSCVGAVISVIIAQRLPTAEMVRVTSMSMIAGQFGRALGPTASTYVFQTAEEMTNWSRGAGTNFARIWMMLTDGIPMTIVLVCTFTRIFGTFGDPSPKERREGFSRNFLM